MIVDINLSEMYSYVYTIRNIMSYISAISSNDKVIVWERDSENQRIQQIYQAPYYFYVDDPEGEFKTIFDTPVSKLMFKNSRE